MYFETNFFNFLEIVYRNFSYHEINLVLALRNYVNSTKVFSAKYRNTLKALFNLI